jgi:hypothetical protein
MMIMGRLFQLKTGHPQTATLTTKGTNAQGKPFSGMSAYDKQ